MMRGGDSCRVIVARLDHPDHCRPLLGPDRQSGRFADHLDHVAQHLFGHLERLKPCESLDT